MSITNNFVDPRQPGEALWPSKYPLAELSKRRALSGEYDFAALYQQTPIPSGGGLFKESWFADRFVDVAPALKRSVRGWDTAGTPDGGDWTCGCKISEEFAMDRISGQVASTGRFFIEDMVRAQLGPDGVDKLMRLTAELDGVVCAQREEREGGASGLTVIAARRKLLVGFDYGEMPISGSKITRSKPLRSQAEGGNIYLVRDKGRGGAKNEGWNKDFIAEIIGFPTAKHDDQVDATSCAFNAVLLEPPPVVRGLTW